MSKTSLDSWLDSGEYLPEPLRDFHDQKDIFKAMHKIISEPDDVMFKRPSWVDGQVYVIDTFLWFMARRGYTLQRSRKNIEFRDLNADIQRMSDKRDKSFIALFKQGMEDAKP